MQNVVHETRNSVRPEATSVASTQLKMEVKMRKNEKDVKTRSCPRSCQDTYLIVETGMVVSDCQRLLIDTVVYIHITFYDYAAGE